MGYSDESWNGPHVAVHGEFSSTTWNPDAQPGNKCGQRAGLTALALLLCGAGFVLPAWVGWLFDAALAVVMAAVLVRAGSRPVRRRERQVRFRAVTWLRRVPIAAAE